MSTNLEKQKQLNEVILNVISESDQLKVGDMVLVQDPGAYKSGAINKWNGPYKLIDIDNTKNGKKHGQYIVKMNTKESRWPVAKKA